MTIRTRFAPSPPGYLHICGVRTCLFSWLYARHHRGTFILRVEDTDRERSTQAAVDVIIEGMRWLNLDWDEGPIFQSQRGDRYRSVIQELMARDQAYHCYCSRTELDQMREEARKRGDKPKYDGRCRRRVTPPPSAVQPVVRFKTPLEGEIAINDLIQGRVVYRNSELDDLIIARSDGSPTYNLTVVADDLDMKISHVIRGDDHLNNTARQAHIYQALGVPAPAFAHIPLILAPDGHKLSKRHGTVSVLEYREAGYLPEALLNYLVRLGWSHGDQEVFSRDEMVALFDITDVNKAAAAINPDKLLWLNQHYLKQAAPEYLAPLLGERLRAAGLNTVSGPELDQMAQVQQGRTRTLNEMADQSRLFYQPNVTLDPGLAAQHLSAEVRPQLVAAADALETLNPWSDEAIHGLIEQIAARFEMKIGKLAQPLRMAVTGGGVSPSIDKTLRLLGRERSVTRIRGAIEYIDALSS